MSTPTLHVADATALIQRVVAELERAVVGKRDVLELVLLGVVADGHVLLDDVPGVAKTLMARSLATACGLDFRRIQMTPDLLPADITGSVVIEPGTGAFAFRPGPVFGHLVLADEVNRAPAKTQAALLEAMQEHQVTVDGTSHPLPRPFVVVATQNPIEQEGTYQLPEAQLDRFLLCTAVGYPTEDDELTMVARRLERRTDEVALDAVCAPADVLALQGAVEAVHVDPVVSRYAVTLVRASRDHPDIAVGVSPRGALALVKLARAHALLHGRDFADPDDVKAVAVPALAHRLVLRPELWVRGVPATDVLRRLVDAVAAPSWR